MRPFNKLYLVIPILTLLASYTSALADSPTPTYPQPDRYAVMLHNGNLNFPSPWLESERIHYQAVLKHAKADIIVVPVQTQNYAIDRIGRYLITRYLADAIQSSTTQKVADVTLVSRAIGEYSRIYSRQAVYQLANMLGAKLIVWSFAGHKKDGKLTLTIALDEKTGEIPSDKTSPTERTWNDIAFSDVHLPSELILELRNDILKLISLGKGKEINKADPNTGEIPEIPTSFAEISKQDQTPLESAYYYQLLGLLSPHMAERARERFFERSLLALRHISNEDPNYRLILARAYFHLHRRPAAKHFLGKPSSEEERAMAALLDGNLVSLSKITANISHPLPRLLAEIELADLRWSYDQPADLARSNEILDAIPKEWHDVVQRALYDKDDWMRQSNIFIKKILDNTFPIQGPTAESLLTGAALMGDSLVSLGDIGLSVKTHINTLIDSGKAPPCCQSENIAVTSWDIIYLLEALGKANLLKSLQFEISTQGSPQKAISLYDLYKPIYEGHPGMTYLYAIALADAAKKKTGPSSDYMKRLSIQLAERAYTWEGGQSRTSMGAAIYLIAAKKTVYPLYNGDFPRRYYWFPKLEDGDMSTVSGSAPYPKYFTNFSRALSYTHDDFDTLLRMYELFPSNHPALVKALSTTSAGRFKGHPKRTDFLADLKIKGGKLSDAIDILYQDVSEEPYNWSIYEKLGNLLLEEGKTADVDKLFKRYPGFEHSENDKNVRLNPVDISNNAARAGLALLHHGDADDASYFFEISSDTQTGSQYQLICAEMVGLSKRDFFVAALAAKANAIRYNDTLALKRYILYLKTFGYSELANDTLKQANTRFDSLRANLQGVELALARLSGESKDVAELSKKYAQPNATVSTIEDARLLDAEIHESLIDRIPTDADIAYIREKTKGLPIGDRLAVFLEGYKKAAMGDYKGAMQKFKFCIERKGEIDVPCLSYLPYIAWASVKSGDIDSFDDFMKSISKWKNRKSYLIASAIISGAKGQYKTSIEMLNQSLYEKNAGQPLLGSPYEIFLACNWLYQLTNEDIFRAHGLKWVTWAQLISPLQGWPYAAEALFSQSKQDQIEALGIAYKLDKNSMLLKRFSDKEIKASKDWLKINNPFKQNRDTSEAFST